MPKFYIITYWYRDPWYNKEHSGDYYCQTLQEVGGFYGMIERYGGWCQCFLSERV